MNRRCSSVDLLHNKVNGQVLFVSSMLKII